MITCYAYIYTVVYYMALWSANHTIIRVINTTQCHMIYQLVWYAIFYSVPNDKYHMHNVNLGSNL